MIRWCRRWESVCLEGLQTIGMTYDGLNAYSIRSSRVAMSLSWTLHQSCVCCVVSS